MNKQKLLNTPFKSFYLNPFRVRYFACLFLFLGISFPAFTQDLNPCSSIQVIGTSENGDPNNGGAVFQGILVSNEVTPNQAIKIYNEDWEQINECNSSECGNPYTFATDAGKYFVQVQLFNEDETWLCQSDPFEVTVSESGNPCATFCQQEVVEFTSQAEIDAFCGCEVITGDVRITGDVTSLTPLNGLKKIDGFLAIFNSELLDFKGLESLTSIGTDIYLGNNTLLKSLEGLGNIPQLGGSFVVENHPLLESLNGINLQSVKVLTISGNDALIDLTAFKDIQKLRGLSITANKSLQNLEGLNQLTTLGEGPTMGGGFFSLVIGGNAALQNVDALANLQATTEGILLEANSALTNCCGIAHLIDDDPNNGQSNGVPSIKNNAVGCNSVEEILAHCQTSIPDCDNIALSINSNNPQTIDIAGLTTPHYIVKVYDADWNQLLSCTDDCTAVGEYAAGLYRIHVQLYDADWQYICETDFLEITIEDHNNCETFCQQAIVEFTSQADIDAFCGCEIIEGDLRINGEGSDITSLDNLKSIKRVNGFLAIIKTDIIDLQGLDNLESTGDAFVVIENAKLQDYKGIGKLQSVQGTFVVGQNPVLKSLEGLNSLQEINGSLDINTNDELVDITNFRNIKKLRAITMVGNTRLPNLEGLNQLTTLGEGPTIGGTSISLVLAGNAAMQHLDALANLQSTKERIVVQSNESLTNCCGIAHLIDADSTNGDSKGIHVFMDNQVGCNSVAEILAHCTDVTPSCDNITLSGEDGKITIGNLNAPIEIIKIYDENWNRIFECNNDCADPTIFETAAGKYYVQVQLYTENWEWICMTDNLEVTVGAGNGCGDRSYCQRDQIILSTQAEVDAFCGCESVTGDLIIGNVNSLEMTDITSLAALNGLKEVGRDLLIYRTVITDLKGLSNLATVKGSLVMETNPILTDLDGLDNLRNIEGGIVLFSNSNLTTLDGINLDNLGFFTSTNNPSLSNVSALSNFTHLNNISIFGPHPSSILDGFNNLTSLGSDEIGNALFIGGINNLVNLDGLSNLTQIDGNVTINNNEALANCCAILHLIDDNPNNGQIAGILNLSDNRAGCNSVEEILENCTNPTPTCEDIMVTISDLIIENGQSHRDVSVTFNTPNRQRTGVVLLRRSNNELLLDCSICEINQNWRLETGEYVLITDRSYLDLSNGNQGCGDVFIIDVPATPCTDNDGDYICDYNECNDNDSEVTDMQKPVGTPCNDGDDTTGNDMIQADGCTCAGIPISDNICDNVSLLATNDTALILINGIPSTNHIVKVYNEGWDKIIDCSTNLGVCNLFGTFRPGLYRIYVQLYNRDWEYICETDFMEITIPETESGSRENDDFINEQAITIFPNPVHHTLNLRTNVLNGKKGSIQIFNTFGQQIAFIPQKEFSETYETIDITEYQNGLYFMVIKMDNQRMISKPFLIEKLE